MNILFWIAFGLVAGVIAKLLLPGRDPGGCIITMLLGVLGAFVGGFLYTTLTGLPNSTSAASWSPSAAPPSSSWPTAS